MKLLTVTRTLGALALVLGLAVAPAQAESEKTLKIGWTAWSDAEIVTNIAKQVLEEKLGYQVKLVMADIGLQYQGVARGDLDVMLMAWLPTTHKPYWDKFKDDLVNLGKIYGPTRNGWVVPAYVPESELKSIPDLAKPEVKEKLDGKIQGIDPGAGMMQAAAKALPAYGLDYNLVAASDAAMVTALARAIRRQEWIVVTAWNPHWIFAEYELRYLEDPKQLVSNKEAVHALARPGFEQDFPKAAAFFANFEIPMSDLEQMLLKAQESSAKEEAAAYIAAHPKRVEQWVEPAMTVEN